MPDALDPDGCRPDAGRLAIGPCRFLAFPAQAFVQTAALRSFRANPLVPTAALDGFPFSPGHPMHANRRFGWCRFFPGSIHPCKAAMCANPARSNPFDPCKATLCTTRGALPWVGSMQTAGLGEAKRIRHGSIHANRRFGRAGRIAGGCGPCKALLCTLHPKLGSLRCMRSGALHGPGRPGLGCKRAGP